MNGKKAKAIRNQVLTDLRYPEDVDKKLIVKSSKFKKIYRAAKKNSLTLHQEPKFKISRRQKRLSKPINPKPLHGIYPRQTTVQ